MNTVANVSTAIVQVIAQFVINGVSLAFAGTGFFIDPNTLLTALHVLVYDGIQAVAVYVKTAVGELLSIPMEDVHTGLPPEEWQAPHGPVTSVKAGYDIAAISIGDNAVGLEMGWFDVDSGFAAGQVNLSGLPGQAFTYQQLSADYQDYGHGINLSHLTGVSAPGIRPGFSGGVAWVNNGIVPTAVGIVTAGDSIAGGQGWAVDLSPSMEQQVVQWAVSDDYRVASDVAAAHVNKVYDLLGLVATKGEVDHWVDQIVAKGLGIDGFYNVALNYTAVKIALLYDTVFNRTPDWPGLSYWIDQYNHGMTFIQIVANFMDSSEYRALYGAPDIPTFIETLYVNILNRASDPAGKAFYVEYTTEKAQEIGLFNAMVDVVAQVSGAMEHIKLLADPNSLAHLNDGQYVVAVDQAHVADASSDHPAAPVSVEIVGVSHTDVGVYA